MKSPTIFGVSSRAISVSIYRSRARQRTVRPHDRGRPWRPRQIRNRRTHIQRSSETLRQSRLGRAYFECVLNNEPHFAFPIANRSELKRAYGSGRAVTPAIEAFLTTCRHSRRSRLSSPGKEPQPDPSHPKLRRLRRRLPLFLHLANAGQWAPGRA